MLKLKYCWVWMALVAGPSAAKADTFALGVFGQPSTTFAFGFQVTSVVPGFAADQLGIKAGDVIYNVNGTNVTSNTDVANAVNAFAPSLTISWLANGVQSANNSATATLTPIPPGVGPADRPAGGKSKYSKATKIKAATPPKGVPKKRR